ncbi:calmodulin-binding transcription activator 3 isoform X2 [Rosa chinensis]|uniref:calmodulin-binding transcription activator 3 isoform X2 n=1 Tax=Rosa chinensis TaxID=74649 RepID=UPI000D094046|nr:calmodulin-binding transcription activator 3 isoform X2 [Rosa chinensis]
MAARKRQRLDDQLELPQILLQAKHRWLRPAEIFEVLQNHSRFCLSEPADKPSSGSLYLYDRNVLRSFRKDGYRWKKTKDGKAVKEAHERLKAGGVEALHCYYAHGEENENFQRRCYWMIEEPLSHIVLVHYREVKTSEGNLSCSSKLPINRNMHSDTAYHASTSFPGGVNADELLNSLGPPCHMNLDKQNDSSVHRHSDKQNDPRILKNLDSSDQCMNTELGDLTELQMSSSRDHSSTIANENGNDGSGALQPVQIAIPGPSLFQDLLFNIIDLSPNWAYENSETEVLVVGKFLKNQELESFKWSCMFGEVEVPAEVVADGVLRCYTPVHRAARIPFYVTRSNRLPCSEVRIFEYRVNQIQDAEFKDDGCEDDTLVMRFGRILSPSFTYSSFNPQDKYRQYDPISVVEKFDLTRKISSLLKNGNEERAEMIKLFPDEFSLDRVKAQLLQQFLKDKFRKWLLQKMAVGGNGLGVLDEGGQGVLHVGAALGYDWVFLPMTMAGVTVNFPDVNGWTALHWAAFRGRESAVSLLIGLGAAPGALTDPCTKSPTGKTPADLASEKGYKGIAAYLSSVLILDINDANSAESPREKLVQPVPERIPAFSSDGDLDDGLSMRAHVTGHQVKKNYGMGWAVRIVGMILRWRGRGKRRRLGYKNLWDDYEGPYNISYDFLMIQAHVTGHQVKKNYGMGWAVRTVGMILRWRGRGKRRRLGYKNLWNDYEGPYNISYDFLKIQAHVTGHQVKKNYGMGWAVRTVGMILRWRGRGKRRRLGHKNLWNDYEDPYNISYDFLKIQPHVTGHQVKKNYGMGWLEELLG